MFKTLLYFYQRIFWYIGQAKNEMLKPLGFWNETILILTFLSIKGYNLNLYQVIGIYCGALLVAALLGKLIVSLGIVKYNTTIANKHNSELTLVITEIQRVNERLDKVLNDK